jgi:low affinity Fe/Cu permease
MLAKHLESFTHRCAKWAGSAAGFVCAILSVCAWGVAGEYFDFSRCWQNGLTIYIGVITYLMIFILQRSQYKELSALQVKLNELVAASRNADNSVINLEEKSEREISEFQDVHRQMASDETQKPSESL